MANLIDLTQSRPIDALDVLSFSDEFEGLVADFRDRDDSYNSLSDLDPAIILLHAIAFKNLEFRQWINEQARACMLAFARGTNVDALVALFNVERILIDPGDAESVPPREPVYESDQALKERFLLKLESTSGAGPRGAYQYHALSAHPDVLDVYASSPSPALVTVAVLSRIGNGAPSTDVLSAVYSALNDEDVRPITDRLTVVPASIIEYSVDVTLTVREGVDGQLIADQAREAIEAWNETTHRVNAGVKISRLTSIAQSFLAGDQFVMSSNINEAIVNSPMADIETTPTSAPYCTSVVVNVEVAA